MFVRTAFALIFASSTLACAAVGATDDRLASVSSATGDATSGASLYAAQCAVCHGVSGGGGSGPQLTGTDETRAIEEMLAGPDEMPEYSALTDQELADLAAFVSAM